MILSGYSQEKTWALHLYCVQSEAMTTLKQAVQGIRPLTLGALRSVKNGFATEAYGGHPSELVHNT